MTRGNLAIGAACIAIANGARAEWTVVFLHPEGAEWSVVYAASGSVQAGIRHVQSDSPVLWHGAAESLPDLTPAWATGGRIYGMDAHRQVGLVGNSMFGHAGLWSGSPESCIDLDPGAPYIGSEAFALAGNQQVGRVFVAGQNHAALWYGDAASFVDLHPAGMTRSAALATDGVRQGGAMLVPGADFRAVLWNGSATDYVVLHPIGARWSGVSAMGPDVQVGSATFADGHDRAMLWHGSAASSINMHPPGTFNSVLNATTGTIHAGYITYVGFAEAGIWVGDDPESFINLNAYLPTGWFSSSANAVSIEGGRIYVGGSACPPEGMCQAILWVGRFPEDVPGVLLQPCIGLQCTTDLTGDCVIGLDDLTTLLSSFGSSAGDEEWIPRADFDGDAAIGISDLAALLSQFGGRCD